MDWVTSFSPLTFRIGHPEWRKVLAVVLSCNDQIREFANVNGLLD